MNIKPLANIGEKVNIKDDIIIQTSYGWNITHLTHSKRGYTVYDIEVTTKLRTGEIEYKYLICNSDPFDKDLKYFHGGWVNDRNIKIFNQDNEMSA